MKHTFYILTILFLTACSRGFTVNQKKYWRFFENKLDQLSVSVVLLTAVSYYMKWKFPQMGKGDFFFGTFNFIKAVNSWLWILLLLSFGKKILNTEGRCLPLLNESVFPVYILHQTVIICLGYFVVQQSWSINTKFFIITIATIIICWLLFLLLRLNKFTRLLFGMPIPSKFKGLQRNCNMPNK